MSLLIGCLFLSVSCNTLHNIKPNQYVYKIIKAPLAQKIMPCFYLNVNDLQTGKNLRCIDNLDTLEGWLILHPDNLKRFLTQGVDELIEIQNQSIPK